jgi:hypothetical protein
MLKKKKRQIFFKSRTQGNSLRELKSVNSLTKAREQMVSKAIK